MLTAAATSLLNKESFIEKFNNDNGQERGTNYGQMIVLLIIIVIWIALVLVVGKYLWNECLCKVVTICKPMNDVFTLVGLVVLLDILRPTLA